MAGEPSAMEVDVGTKGGGGDGGEVEVDGLKLARLELEIKWLIPMLRYIILKAHCFSCIDTSSDF